MSISVIGTLVIPEIAFDLRFDRRVSWKQPSLVAKFVYLLYLISTAYLSSPYSFRTADLVLQAPLIPTFIKRMPR